MKINTKIFYIQVPMNVAGIIELDSCEEAFCNVQTFELSAKEIEPLVDLFQVLNSTYGLLIDEYESERLPAENVPGALAIAHDFLCKHNEARPAVNRLIAALQLAKELRMPVEFDF